jgi:hypothetical protein
MGITANYKKLIIECDNCRKKLRASDMYKILWQKSSVCDFCSFTFCEKCHFKILRFLTEIFWNEHLGIDRAIEIIKNELSELGIKTEEI